MGFLPRIVSARFHIQRQDLLQVRQRPGPVLRAQLPPPHVDLLLPQLPAPVLPGSIAQDPDVLLHGAGRQDRVPHGEEMPPRGDSLGFWHACTGQNARWSRFALLRFSQF
jgi:hypothetical protein